MFYSIISIPCNQSKCKEARGYGNARCILNTVLFIFLMISGSIHAQTSLFKQVSRVLKKELIERADLAMTLMPMTVTASYSTRSAGGLHDFFSEGDYWWPDSSHPEGPYIQRDGMTNPDNFTAHRLAMIRFSRAVGELTSAYLLTHDQKYAEKALQHMHAWFVDTATMMNPSLLYAQAIQGRFTGRGIGIIDMIQMMEVAQSAYVLERMYHIDPIELAQIKNWFTLYIKWVTTHPYGVDEREAKNNHGTCWTMQVAVFAKFVGDTSMIQYCKDRFKHILLPNQLAADGSFPLELKRTKPYGYSLFNLDAMTTLCFVLSDQHDNLWSYQQSDFNTMRKAIDFLFPYVKNKNTWSYPHDVMYWEEWPVAHPFLLFGYIGYKNKAWLQQWKSLNHFPEHQEVVRNLPIRNPLIWIY